VGWFTPTASCTIVFTTSRYQWYQASDVVGLVYYLPQAGLVGMVSPWPGHSYEEVLAELAPVIETLTITPRLGD
jgi:hypothetical protein